MVKYRNKHKITKSPFSAEDFGTAWAVDDEPDCPIPLPPPDNCVDAGLETEKPGYEIYIDKVLKGLFKLEYLDISII